MEQELPSTKGEELPSTKYDKCGFAALAPDELEK